MPKCIVIIKALAAQVIDGQIGEYQSSPVLEVGCGDNFFRDWLAPEWLRSRLIGFDINLSSFGSPLLLVQDATVVLHTPLLGNPDAASVERYHLALERAFMKCQEFDLESSGDLEMVVVEPRESVIKRVGNHP